MNISQADKDITDKLIKVGWLVKIEVLDHLIITETGFTSFKDKGIMEELRTSGFYELVTQKSEQMKAFKLEIKKEKADKTARVDIARRLKQATGLNKREIDKA